MTGYALLKLTHVACVTATYALFVLRGVWMINGSARLQQKWVKTVPHIVDTVLLGSAIALVVISRQYPLVASWLIAKVIALVVYIALGMVALKRGKSMRARVAAWIGAQIVFGYILAVAFTRNPLPWV